eukprot:10513042-Alexandrium_andersonii.AAC.1
MFVEECSVGRPKKEMMGLASGHLLRSCWNMVEEVAELHNVSQVQLSFRVPKCVGKPCVFSF